MLYVNLVRSVRLLFSRRAGGSINSERMRNNFFKALTWFTKFKNDNKKWVQNETKQKDKMQ